MTHHWTEEQKTEFTKLWNAGVKVDAIQRHFGVAQQTADALRISLGLPTRARNAWSAAEQEIVKARWAKGDSAATIAMDLRGRTRNSVIGLVFRLGLTHAGRAAPSRPQGVRAVRVPSVPRSHVRPPKPGPQNKPAVIHGDYAPSTDAMRLARAAEGRAANDKVAKGMGVESPNARPWMENRRLDECNWPIGGRYEIKSCCNPVVARGWCAGHLAIGVAPVQPQAMRSRDASRLTRFDRVEKDRAAPVSMERSVWDDARAEAA